MKKEFRIRRVFRITLLVLCAPAVLLFIYETALYLSGIKSAIVNGPIDIFISAFIFLMIFDWYKTRYILIQNHLIVQQPFWKEKTFDLNDIKRIFEMKGPFPSIGIRLNSKRFPIYLNIDESDIFVSSIINIAKGSKSFICDSDNKGINFNTK